MKSSMCIVRVCALLGVAQVASAANSGLFEPYESFTPTTLRTASVSSLAVADINNDVRWHPLPRSRGRPDHGGVAAGERHCRNLAQSEHADAFVYRAQGTASATLRACSRSA